MRFFLCLKNSIWNGSLYNQHAYQGEGVSDSEALASRRLGTAKNRNTELHHIFPYLGFDIVDVLLDLLFILTLTDKNDIFVLYNDIVFQAL